MGRYLGPKHKLCRKFGEKLCDSPKCPVIKRPYRPGQHGPKRPPRLSEYGLQLREKQKASGIYRVFEKQFRNYYNKAKRRSGDTGENLVQLLEIRLDNVIYRFGFAKTRDSSRQFISHGHVTVNAKKLDIPSYQVKIGDVIAIKTPSLDKILFKEIVKSINKKDIPSWLSLEDEKILKGKVVSLPVKEHLQQGFDTSLIIEFYSR
ncbi:30S ribosomal protein S4 [Patescibacteria group bacterium]|nr:30S ribosomal protein S4 [Patescibacteria group bacterium]